ncbi:MAG: hypothetical protein ACO4BW_06365, partial [Nitriliruptoraceae bacterium]
MEPDQARPDPTDGPAEGPAGALLTGLTAGQPVVFAGDRVATVPAALAAAFAPGDALLVDDATGGLLHVPAAARAAARAAGDAARAG